MSKKREKGQRPEKITQFLLDESFLLCASGKGCDATECHEEIQERKRIALIALLIAYQEKIRLVLDDKEPSQVAKFYYGKNNLMSAEVRSIIVDWLRGLGHTVKSKPATMSEKTLKECNLKENTLDPLLCQLALASRGNAPVWTLDSDFWCANQFYPEIKPTCPQEALNSVR
ncbi:MAG: hypothetical protein DRR16_05945 [Candidatus Parabeggiatoa sp. nov. 3]|nr:MAG: hypothetical protein DRR00_17520 [Gammaproteobacteria bacterium]RKZ65036.1 MAG: hypothetical protein DRQ99_13805 [Gammaproteobacteria bacterium]RKZ87977.1 MAG: hypothetical protein DRR16_05945 [Gammaproteobacteria bacterium]